MFKTFNGCFKCLRRKIYLSKLFGSEGFKCCAILSAFKEGRRTMRLFECFQFFLISVKFWLQREYHQHVLCALHRLAPFSVPRAFLLQKLVVEPQYLIERSWGALDDPLATSTCKKHVRFDNRILNRCLRGYPPHC